MNSKDYWEVFLETGAPEMYLLYSKFRRVEQTYVPDSASSGAAHNAIQ